MDKTIRIGTRDSDLALWQANTVKFQLENLGYKTILVPVKSTGDLILDKPLYELGITGIFTKTLDVAMLNGTVDIAVHSMKDVPTALPKGIVQTAVLPRATSLDLLVTKGAVDFSKPCTIATGSLRRKAQWLHKYPHHTVVDLRGNVNTRLQKLQDNNWEGAIFAKAGLERLNFIEDNLIKSPNFKGTGEELNWMIPAPAQGAMVIVALDTDKFCKEATEKLNDATAEICTTVERMFLKTLEGGCTAPIGAYADFTEDNIHFKGCLFSLDGTQQLEIACSITTEEYKIDTSENFGSIMAQELLDDGGKELMKNIKLEMGK